MEEWNYKSQLVWESLRWAQETEQTRTSFQQRPNFGGSTKGNMDPNHLWLGARQPKTPRPEGFGNTTPSVHSPSSIASCGWLCFSGILFKCVSFKRHLPRFSRAMRTSSVNKRPYWDAMVLPHKCKGWVHAVCFGLQTPRNWKEHPDFQMTWRRHGGS